MPGIELLVRTATVTEIALLALLLSLNSRDRPVYRATTLMLAGVASYTLAPLVVVDWSWGAASYPLLFMAMIVPAFFWLLAGTLFDDGFAAGRWSWLLILLTGAAGFTVYCGPSKAAGTCLMGEGALPTFIAQLPKIAWLVAAFLIVLRDWRGDLVEQRRRLRLWLVALAGGYILVVLVVEALIPEPMPDWLELANAVLLLAVVTALAVHLLAVNENNLLLRVTAVGTPTASDRSPLAQAVLTAMEESRAYAAEGLTIDALANTLGCQPYQLRQVINGELGQRNFNTFINGYRVAEVARRLTQEQYSDTPLLTLALDAGFRSLAPFNRSFREQYGVTPSEYRRAGRCRVE
ncbi:MAG: helix-turn-helix transcriptional regulator [Halioglobus sp.]|nr:helix-turn-helix transcriptional regulator [Halioglobus sp.]